MALTQAQIQTAFVNSLGRQPSSAELNSYFSVSQSGALSDQAIFQTISNSTEADQIADPVIRFYQAAFGRVPDQAGLQNAENFVRAFTPTAATYQNLAAQFTTSTEFTNRYGSGTTVDAAFVQSLYTNILGRQGSSAEITGYTSGSNGYTTRAQVFYAISQSNEAISINNTAVNNFELAAAQGQAVYTGSLPAPTSASNNIALTTGVDNLTGTAGNDAYNAILGTTGAGGQAATLNSFDNIQDQGGTDTLNILVTPGATTIPAGITISGIETININETQGASLNAAINAATFVGATSINETATGGSTFQSVNNVQSGEVVSFTSVDGTNVIPGAAAVAAAGGNPAVAQVNTVTAASGVTSETVSITKVATAGVVYFGETTGNDVTSVTLNGSVNANGNVTVNTSALGNDSSVKLGVTSNSLVKFAGSANTLTTVDASTSTGNLTLDLANTANGNSEATYTKLSSVTGGSGSDTISTKISTLTGTTTFAVSGGAGNDTLNFNSTHANAAVATTLTGGTGGDTFTITATAAGGVTTANLVDVGTDAKLIASLVTISDFGNGTDVLNTAGLGQTLVSQTVTQNAVNTAVGTTNTLTAAVNAAASVANTAGNIAVFSYGGDTYVYANEHTGATAAAGDGLIKLTGVSPASLTNGNNFIP